MAFRLAWFTIRLGEGGKKKVTCLVHMNDVSGKHTCLQVSNYNLLESREDFKSHIQYNLKLDEYPAMSVQSNYVDSPIQDCAHVSQIWSMLLFYNHNHRSLTYQIAMPLFHVLCTKGMSQGFGEM